MQINYGCGYGYFVSWCAIERRDAHIYIRRKRGGKKYTRHRKHRYSAKKTKKFSKNAAEKTLHYKIYFQV